ncbi:NTF2 domain-containing protein [Entamoeba marina]
MPKHSRRHQPFPPRHSGFFKKFLVTGFTGTLNQFKQFLKNIDSGFKNQKIYSVDDNFCVELKFKQLEQKITSLDGTSDQKGAILSVEEVGGRPNTSALETIIPDMINKYYISNTNMVNLSQLNVKLADCGYSKKFDDFLLTKILETISKTKPTLSGISLCDNGIASLSNLKNIHELFPSLTGLILDNNNIKSPNQLDYIKHIPLVVLSLTGNPIENVTPDEYQALMLFVIFTILLFSLITIIYHFSQIRKDFPKLKIYSGNPIGSLFKFPVNFKHALLPIQMGYFPVYPAFATVENWLVKLLQTSNDSWSKLQNNYIPSSVFSSTSSGTANSFAQFDRNHVNSLSQQEYVERLKIGQRIHVFFNTKFTKFEMNYENITFDVFPVQIANMQIINILCFGKCQFGNHSFNFYRTLLINGDLQILNDHIHFFKADKPFVIMKQAKDNHKAVHDVIANNGLQNNGVEDLVLGILKTTNYDVAFATDRLRNCIFPLVQSKSLQPDEAFAICQQCGWDVNQIQQFCRS